ncbi:MAG: ATP-binding protein [Butyrivibrio sp.]|nr:ATP-binding protein [Acetatifactor muris]MCM1560316.1 ATP-binding protein [Butyrivibrio sp.]
MVNSQKYYEDLYFSSGDDRQLLPHNQDVIIDLLNKNGAVGIVGVYDEPGYPIYFISGFALTAIEYSYEEMMQVSEGKFVNLVFDKDREIFVENAGNRELACHEFRMVSKSGKNVWVNSFREKSVSMDNRQIVIASVRVVEDARRRESELLNALTRGYDRIIYVDMNQGRYRVIKSDRDDLDEQVCGTLEELEELLRRYGQEYINPQDHSFAEMLNKLNIFANPGKKGGNYQATYRARMDGEYQWVQFQAFYGGAMKLETGHVILAFRVVDEEKKRELDTNRLLSDSLARAEEAGRVKNQFLSRMSHDLRTPINGIVGMLEIAKKSKNNPEKIEECLKKISISCDNLMSLVQDVLDMNNLESGGLELMEETFHLPSFLSEELVNIADRAEKGGLTYAFIPGDFPHPNVTGSPKHVLQIFEHILDNAIKYNKPNGSIILSGREASGNDRMATYEFVVEDTGIGMEPEFARHIFEPFEQEHNEARTEYRGTGLGMSIVKRLVDRMNGTIAVESRPGEGTKVIFTIPFKVCQETAAPEAENINLAGLRVLLVEDNELNLEIAKFLLEDAGMTVLCATNGQEAIDVFQQTEVNAIDVILMDIMMPVMDGLEAVKRIRRLDRADAETVPIIALSANVMDADIKKTKMAGMDEHLSKPINTSLLLGAIAKCVHR